MEVRLCEAELELDKSPEQLLLLASLAGFGEHEGHIPIPKAKTCLGWCGSFSKSSRICVRLRQAENFCPSKLTQWPWYCCLFYNNIEASQLQALANLKRILMLPETKFGFFEAIGPWKSRSLGGLDQI
jgi:hypothetical protein